MEKLKKVFKARPFLSTGSFFLIITIISYNLLKGNRIILPDLEEELWDSKDFFLLKATCVSLCRSDSTLYHDQSCDAELH